MNRWEIGGTITAVLDGTEGQRMLDNLTIDNSGHIILQEDPGNQSYNARMWQYNIQTDEIKPIGQHLPSKFISGNNTDDFLTQDEESSGIIDVQEILGSGMFLLADQAHYSIPGEVVEGGQLLTMYNPSTDKSNPEIEIYGNNKNIIINDVTPSIDDNTDFGPLKMGVTLSKTFQINNTGLGYLNITEMNIVGADAGDFVIENKPNLPLTINGNASQNLTITFKPTKIGTRNAKLVLRNTDFNEQQFTFQIAGEGLMSTSTNDSKLNVDQFQFTPNPFNQYLNLNFKLNSHELISCNIQDINGKLIKTPFTNKHFQAGNNLEIINTSTLAPGMYIIELISGNTKYQFKLAKVF
ncbi:MAG: choice-of-anchor D domain-containing protein [Saprospiraceae bacterium]|uniref:Choice-of-anchor D domain-containing protein n=1 Tax=Candidatus Defluviibacterium haderslevense TaxID=2981993 RepID=A0A9D7S7F3_9BACT|nr:choice-of-anchor D domain-containing protein [Candidatus Defluviibacterium haderslevense]